MAVTGSHTASTFDTFSLASLYLRTAGLPDTPRNRRILAAWMMAESFRVDKYHAHVYDNNPLNITCTTCSDYHQFPGISLKFVNFSGTTAGAQGWANLVSRRYPGIYNALKGEDQAAFHSALASSPWGTSPRLWYSVFFGLPDQGPGTTIDYGDSSSLDKGGVVRPGQTLSGFKNLYSKPVGSTFTNHDVIAIMDLLKANHWFDGPNPIATLIAQSDFSGILQRHIGEPWNQELLAKIATETGVAAVNSNFVGETLHDALPNADLFARIGQLLDPTHLDPNLFHMFGILIGTGLMIYGVRVIFRNAGVDGVSAGGGTNTVVERYPMVIKDSPEAPSMAQQTAPANNPTPTPRSNPAPMPRSPGMPMPPPAPKAVVVRRPSTANSRSRGPGVMNMDEWLEKLKTAPADKTDVHISREVAPLKKVVPEA